MSDFIINFRDGRYKLISHSKDTTIEDITPPQGTVGVFEDEGNTITLIVEATECDTECKAWFLITPQLTEPEKDCLGKKLNDANIDCKLVFGNPGNPTALFVPYDKNKEAIQILQEAFV